MRIFGIQFAPLNIPLTRRLETLALAWHVFSIPIFASTFMFFCALPPLWPILIAYIIYVIYDKSPYDGRAAKRYSPVFRSLWVWRLFANYFPITIHKTVDLEPSFIPGTSSSPSADTTDDLDPPPPPYSHDNSNNNKSTKSSTSSKKRSRLFDLVWKLTFWWWYYIFHRSSSYDQPIDQMKRTNKRYIFGYHPHGIIGMGAIGGLATEGAGWSRLFPGVRLSTLTLSNQFKVPLYREYLLALGIGSVSRPNCEALLKQNQSICIVVGGAQESLLARPGRMDLVLQKRKGFVKLALELGNTNLVPMIAFGENELYDQVKNEQNSKLYKLQTLLKDLLGFTLPLMHARGVFNYDVGIIPYRHPINILVGSPLEIPHIPNPSHEDINRYQDLYISHLEKLYEENKYKFSEDGNPPDLTFVE